VSKPTANEIELSEAVCSLLRVQSFEAERNIQWPHARVACRSFAVLWGPYVPDFFSEVTEELRYAEANVVDDFVNVFLRLQF